MNVRNAFLLPLVLLLAALPCSASVQSAGATDVSASSIATSAPSAATAGQSDLATITYRKIFKGSTPEYVEIKIDEHGAATYDIRQLDDQPSPQSFQVSSALTAKIFSLAADLHDFKGIQLDARRLIANLGQKTFRFQRGEESYRVSFNYTVNATANQLMGIFEGLSLEDQYLDQLTRSMRYDPLGLDDVLTRLQSDLESHAVAEPQVLAPVLEKIASNRQFLDVARERARLILSSLGKVQ